MDVGQKKWGESVITFSTRKIQKKGKSLMMKAALNCGFEFKIFYFIYETPPLCCFYFVWEEHFAIKVRHYTFILLDKYLIELPFSIYFGNCLAVIGRPSWFNHLNARKGQLLCKNWVQNAADEGKILVTTYGQLVWEGELRIQLKDILFTSSLWWS